MWLGNIINTFFDFFFFWISFFPPDFGEDISQVNVIAGDTKAEETLRSCRTEIINRISDPNLNKILDKLQHQSVLNSEEADTFMTKGRAEKARCLIDTVHRKGSKASAILINAICEVDSHLSKQLKLSWGAQMLGATVRSFFLWPKKKAWSL